MSNFSTWGVVNNAIPGTAQHIFVASTPDSLATILAAGYMNDKAAQIKANDLVYVSYSDLSAFPLSTGENAISGLFQIFVSGTNYNLVPSASVGGLVQMANSGFRPKYFVNAGGSATTTFNDSVVNVNSIVFARWQTSANAVKVEKVTASNGSLTVLSSGDPGASVLEYFVASSQQSLVNAGIYAKQFTNAGGSATVSITDANITANSIVVANFSSSANAVIVEKVTPGAGTLTVLCTGDPGASVLNYMAISNNNALNAAGVYAASFTNPGGSATTVISDSKITAASVVLADWNTSANAVQVEKVTPAAGSLTILSSGDPGASVLSYQVASQGV